MDLYNSYKNSKNISIVVSHNYIEKIYQYAMNKNYVSETIHCKNIYNYLFFECLIIMKKIINSHSLKKIEKKSKKKSKKN